MKIALVPLSAALLGGASPVAPHAADAMCPALKKVIAATSETPVWKSVRKGNAGTAFAGMQCSITSYSSENQYFCDVPGITAANVKARHAKMVADIGACLGVQSRQRGDAIATTNVFQASPSVEVSTTRVEQANANNFGLGLTVTQRF